MATLSVHEFPAIKKGQNILATIKVGNFQKGHKEYTNAVHAGWAPSFYGASKTHFTITWTVCTHHSWQQDNLFVFAFSNL